MSALATNIVVPREETRALAERALAIVRANGAPPSAQLLFDVQVQAQATQDAWDGAVVGKLLTPLLSTAPYAGDPPARAAIRLFIADAERRRSAARARILLKQVGDDAALPAGDPLKVGALVRLASLEQDAGDAAAARAAFDRSGLDASQCAIIDNPPAMVRTGGVFPQEAMQWGFEGWTQTQFDIAADGKVVNERAVLSYPPFIFTKAAKEAIAGSRDAKSYRPDGGLGCGGQSQRVRFALP